MDFQSLEQHEMLGWGIRRTTIIIIIIVIESVTLLSSSSFLFSSLGFKFAEIKTNQIVCIGRRRAEFIKRNVT